VSPISVAPLFWYNNDRKFGSYSNSFTAIPIPITPLLHTHHSSTLHNSFALHSHLLHL